jgi:hypothetical protein
MIPFTKSLQTGAMREDKMINIRRVAFITLTLAQVWTSAHAQNEKNNWIFGHHAKTNFGPVLYTGSPGIDSYDGCSSISDAAGNLLFYTDGVLVWNNNDGVMPAVQSTHLQGDINGAQTALIVPKPGSGCKEYYIFTTGSAFSQVHPTLRYSIVQMNASTGNGLGDVTVKNVVLQPGVSEPVTAVADGMGGYVVMAHGSGLGGAPNNKIFYPFHVTASGITPMPTSTGHPHITGLDTAANTSYPAGWGASGQMKFSQDGTRIASAVPSKYVEVCNFNKTNGQVTGCVVFNSDLAGPHAPFQSPLVFGIEFSPSGHYLYVSTYNDANIQPTPRCQLVQFDLTITNPVGVVVATSDKAPGQNDMGELQLAPDGQIYLARQGRFLSAVQNPDSPSPIFLQMARSIPGTAWGLPNMVQGPSSCATGTPCPPNTTATTIDGFTFCCSTSDDGQTCCKRLCPVGSAESMINGTLLCCTAENGSAFGSNTTKVCCSKPH